MSESQPPAEPILHTKLMPPRLHSTIIPRGELLARLDEGIHKKLTLVSAPTGSGKTTLVSMWLGERGIRSAWVTLDQNDNDPVRFWTYFITGLRTLDPAIGKAALAVLAASQPASYQSFLTPLINDLAQISEPCVVVLEDYHAITAAEIHASVTFLLQHMPASLHLILVTRSEPNLPLGILRARDELLEMDAASLRFSQAETEAFLRQALRVEIAPSTLAKLQEKTEGWAAGLRLAALALQSKGNPQEAEGVIQSFSGSHHYVADYLIREVFESQPQATRDFLLKTCFLNRLTGSLCNAVTGTGSGESVLGQLARENLFLVQLEHGGRRVWYRYNPLFAESIQYLARQRLGEAGVQSIYEQASAWYETQQLYDEAIEAALAAKQYERTAALIEKFIDIHSLSELHTLSRWMERIPEELVFGRPEICLAYAQVILFTADRYAPATAVRMEPLLRAAEDNWHAAGKEEKVGQALALRGMMLLWQGDFQKALRFVYQSLEKLPEQDVFWRGVSLLNAGAGELHAGRMVSAQDKILEARALLGASQNIHGVLAATQMLGEIFSWQGDWEQAAQINQQIIEEAVGGEAMLDDQGVARLGLAYIAYEQNDLETAELRAAQALDLGKQRANETLLAEATVRLAYIQAARGDLAQGRELLIALSAKLQNPSAMRAVQDAQARIALWAGEPETLGWWLTAAAEDQKILFLQKEQEAFILARLRIAQGKVDEALRLLQTYYADAEEQGRLRSQIEALCIEGLAQRASRGFAKAGEAVTQALALGQPKGFRRLFVDEGAGMAALLRDAIPALANRSLSLYATTLLHSFPPEATGARQAAHGEGILVEPLSQQEARVLRLLVAGLSNSEIAGELVVSTNTVKTHVKSIYRKLNINSREEARQVAKALKLL